MSIVCMMVMWWLPPLGDNKEYAWSLRGGPRNSAGRRGVSPDDSHPICPPQMEEGVQENHFLWFLPHYKIKAVSTSYKYTFDCLTS